MSTPIQLKRSKTAGNTPASLADGELAINLTDRKLFVNDGSGAIQSVDLTADSEKVTTGHPIGDALAGKLSTSGGSLSGNLSVTGNVAATGAVLTTAAIPVYQWRYTGTSPVADQNIWEWHSDASSMGWNAVNDAYNTATPVIKATRSGMNITGLTLSSPTTTVTGVITAGDTTSAAPTGLILAESANGSSRKAQMNIGTGWTLGQDIGQTGNKNLFLYSQVYGAATFQIDPATNVVNFTKVPTANGNSVFTAAGGAVAGTVTVQTAATGYGSVSLYSGYSYGGTDYSGYVAFADKTGTRHGYVGSAYGSVIGINADPGYHYDFNVTPTVNNQPIIHGTNVKIIAPGLFGVVGDGATDDLNALQTLINNTPDHITLMFMGGTYRISNTLTVTNRSLFMVSAGVGAATFLCDLGGVSCTTNTLLSRFHIEGFVFQRSSAGVTANGAVSSCGIQITRPTGLSSSTEPGAIIRNNTFIGQYSGSGTTQPSYTSAWYYAVYLTAGWNSFIEGNFYRGKDSDYSGLAFYITDHTTPLNFHRNIVTFAGTGLNFTSGSFAEGLDAFHNEFVAVLDGFFLDDGQGAPQARIIGNHINGARYCIRAMNRPQLWVADNLIYNWNYQGYGQGAGTYAFVGIQLEGTGASCTDSIIRNNIVIGFNNQTGVTGSTQSIVIQNSFATLIQGNEFVTCTNAINGVGTYKGRIFANHCNGVTTFLYSCPSGSLTANNSYSNDGATLNAL